MDKTPHCSSSETRLGLWIAGAVVIGCILLLGLQSPVRRNLAIRQLRGMPGVTVDRAETGAPPWLRPALGEWLDPVTEIFAAELSKSDADVLIRSLPLFPELGELTVPLDDADAGSLKHCPNLRRLCVTGAQFSDLGLHALPVLPQLKVLVLSGTAVTDDGLPDIVRQTELEELALSGTVVSSAGLGRLSTLTGLRILEVDNTRVDETAVRELRGRLPELEVFDD